MLRAALLVLTLAAPAMAEAPRILVMGDSLLAWHSAAGKSVADRLEALTGAEVRDMSVGGARMIYNLPVTGALGLSIPRQYRKGDWDWVVINGGGNDLWFGCGCVKCDRKLGKLISADGRRGAIPKLVKRLRDGGARVLWLGYLGIRWPRNSPTLRPNTPVMAGCWSAMPMVLSIRFIPAASTLP